MTGAARCQYEQCVIIETQVLYQVRTGLSGVLQAQHCARFHGRGEREVFCVGEQPPDAGALQPSLQLCGREPLIEHANGATGSHHPEHRRCRCCGPACQQPDAFAALEPVPKEQTCRARDRVLQLRVVKAALLGPQCLPGADRRVARGSQDQLGNGDGVEHRALRVYGKFDIRSTCGRCAAEEK